MNNSIVIPPYTQQVFFHEALPLGQVAKIHFYLSTVFLHWILSYNFFALKEDLSLGICDLPYSSRKEYEEPSWLTFPIFFMSQQIVNSDVFSSSANSWVFLCNWSGSQWCFTKIKLKTSFGLDGHSWHLGHKHEKFSELFLKYFCYF